MENKFHKYLTYWYVSKTNSTRVAFARCFWRAWKLATSPIRLWGLVVVPFWELRGLTQSCNRGLGLKQWRMNSNVTYVYTLTIADSSYMDHSRYWRSIIERVWGRRYVQSPRRESTPDYPLQKTRNSFRDAEGAPSGKNRKKTKCFFSFHSALKPNKRNRS